MIAFNSLSGALALMSEDNHKLFMLFCEEGRQIENEELIKNLQIGGFVIADDSDELDIIRLNMLAKRYNTNSLVLTIVPTSDCNFSCTYCYEKKVIKNDYMKEEIQDKIIEIVRNQSNALSSLNICWFGGEPLLAINIIERLTNAFLKICYENNITYTASMVTNGYLLNRQNVVKLNELKIQHLQVTIDGLPEEHNKRRPLVNGGGTFDIIMKNLIENVDILPPVGMRINIDKNNINSKSGEYVYNYIVENRLTKKVTPYLGSIGNRNECVDSSECLDTLDYSKEYMKHSIYISKDSQKPSNVYPRRLGNYCQADRYNSHLIGPSGDLYRCWSDIGIATKSIGNILNESDTLNRLYYKYMMFDPTMIKPCNQCNLLPICMGGCPQRRLDGDSDMCTIYRYIMEECLTNITESFNLKTN